MTQCYVSASPPFLLRCKTRHYFTGSQVGGTAPLTICIHKPAPLLINFDIPSIKRIQGITQPTNWSRTESFQSLKWNGKNIWFPRVLLWLFTLYSKCSEWPPGEPRHIGTVLSTVPCSSSAFCVSDKESGERLSRLVEEACMLLADYSGRLAAEIDDRRQLTRTLTLFLQSQKDGLAQNEQKLEVRKSFFFQCWPHLLCHYDPWSVCSRVATLVYLAFKLMFVFMYFSMLCTQWSACGCCCKITLHFQPARFLIR